MTVCTDCRQPLTPRPSRKTPGRIFWAAPGAFSPLVCWTRPGTDLSHRPAPSFEEQVEEARREVEAAVLDSRGDFPDLGDDDRYHEMVEAVTFGLPPAVVNEVRRRFGFDPIHDF